MQLESGAEKAVMMDGTNIPAPRPLSLVDDPQVKRTRKVLLVILGVFFAFSVIGTIATISRPSVHNFIGDRERTGQVGQSLISLLFYGFGLFVTYRYYQTGLRVFAWLGVIALISMAIGIGFLLIMIITVLIGINHVDEPVDKSLAVGLSVTSVVFIIIGIAIFAVTVIIVKFAFKLARLIDANKHLITQQI